MAKKRTRVYLLTEGSYSDYHVCAVFANKKDADEALKRKWGENVEAHDLMETLEHAAPVQVYHVTLDREGNEVNRYARVEHPWGYSFKDESGKDVRGYVWSHSKRGYGVALKAARDKLGIKKAEEAGLV